MTELLRLSRLVTYRVYVQGVLSHHKARVTPSPKSPAFSCYVININSVCVQLLAQSERDGLFLPSSNDMALQHILRVPLKVQ